jgi:hypothetical protein
MKKEPLCLASGSITNNAVKKSNKMSESLIKLTSRIIEI